MTLERILEINAQMGIETTEEEILRVKNLDPSEFPLEAQQALIMYNVLPDKVEGMSGTWLGKDYAGLTDIMDIYGVDNKFIVFEFLQVLIDEAYKFYSERQKNEINRTNSK